MKGSWRKLGICVDSGISCVCTIKVSGVMIGDEHRHKSFDGMYIPQYQVHQERASEASDLFELIPGAICGRIILLCEHVRDKVNDCIHHAILQRMANPSLLRGLHFNGRAFSVLPVP